MKIMHLFRLCLSMVLLNACIHLRAQERPNILIIMTDELSAESMSFNLGNKYINTPNIDQLAKKGVVFSNAYCSNPLCVPSRSSIFTGRYPHELGIQNNEEKKIDPKTFPSMGSIFKNAGYETGYVGKWHLPYDRKATDTHGFDYLPNKTGNGHDSTSPNLADDFIKTRRNNPFLLVVSFMNPHNICQWARGEKLPDGAIGDPPPAEQCPPLRPNARPSVNESDIMKFMRTSMQNNDAFPVGGFTEEKWRQYIWSYYRLIEKVDAEIGRVMQSLKESGKDKNTIIVFTSDHGDMQGAHLWNQKTVFYEEAAKVPFIINYQGIKPRTSSYLVQSGTDILPTLSEFAGIPLPASYPGNSLKQYLEKNISPSKRDYVVVSDHIIQGAGFDGKDLKPEGRMLRNGQYKYWIYDEGKERESLFDVKNDPGEMINLVNDTRHAKALQECRSQLMEWAKKNNDPYLQKLISPFLDAPYPKIRIWTSPSKGEEPRFNSPSLQWPSSKKATYSVRLSASIDFSKQVIEKSGFPYAIFNPHAQLTTGKWYWQFRTNDGAWNPIDSFVITPSTRKFPTPVSKEMMLAISPEHPRVLVKKQDQSGFRMKVKGQRETSLIIQEANSFLKEPISKESMALPTYKGKDDFENDKIAMLASKWTGWKVQKVLNTFSQAYVLTGDTVYFRAARAWMMELASWDPNGPSHKNDFGDAGIMSSLAIGLDSFWDLLTVEERAKIIQQASSRAKYFYALWVGQVESRSSSMHVWQHILHNMLQTSLALHGEVPEAKKWLEYIYELWIAQSPKMAEEDGAWFNGTSYFGMNTLTLIDVSSIFKDLTGVDFMGSTWFKNNPRWLTYSFPPNSVADGFCNDGDKYSSPNLRYAGYTDAMARLFNDPYAVWYSKTILAGLGKDIAEDDEFRWFRLKKGHDMKLPMLSSKQTFPQAAVFPEIGVAYMHTTLQNSKTDLMLSLRSSPYASMAHTHADQNTFNIAYGGKRLFYNSGYRPAMGDPHFLDWYKHTQGHNGILIDGKGQPFNAGAYGYLPRFLHGQEISYAVGDASNAYSGKDEGQNIDHGMKISKRHFIMLRPSIVVIYDELEADHPATWSWLLHNDNKMILDPLKKTILAGNEFAKAQVSLFSSSTIDFKLSDQFSVPVDNWTNKVNEDGDTVNFKDQWHFKAESTEKKEKMRYLAIIQVKPDGSFQPLNINKSNGVFTIGNWHITAEMDAAKPALIKAWNKDQSAMLVSSGSIVNQGKTFAEKDLSSSKLLEIVNGKPILQEAKDEVPASIKRLMLMNQQLDGIKNN